MWLLTILYEGLALCSMLAPTETIIIGPTELTPAKEVGSSRFWSEGQITSLHYSQNTIVIFLLIKPFKSHLGGYDSNHLCSFPLFLLHHRPTITTTSNARLISFQCDHTGWKVSRALWDMGVHGGWGFGWDRGWRGWDSLGVCGMRCHCCFLCNVIINGGLLRKFHLTGQPKRCELGLLGERDRRQASLHWRVQRLHANLWLRASWQVIWGAAFRQEKVTGSGEDFAEAWQVFGGAEGRLREKYNRENCSRQHINQQHQ